MTGNQQGSMSPRVVLGKFTLIVFDHNVRPYASHSVQADPCCLHNGLFSRKLLSAELSDFSGGKRARGKNGP